MYAPGDVRVEDRPDPKIAQPTDAIIRLAATCICGSDLGRTAGSRPFARLGRGARVRRGRRRDRG